MIQYEHPVVQQDLHELGNAPLNWHALSGKTLVVAGATGMIASYVSFLALYLKEHLSLNINLILLAKSQQKLERMYGSRLKHADVRIHDICNSSSPTNRIDYILHAAGDSSPEAIINDPVGIIRTNTEGTFQMLEWAREGGATKFVFLSTREVYGKVELSQAIRETDTGYLDPLNGRSCYPESKRMAEALLVAYSSQYGIPFNTLRIAHSYGPGMQLDRDGRVLADLMQAIVHGRDIQLKSDGQAIRAFCYITDTVEAIYRVMIDGSPNEAYNIANESEPVSILELAEILQLVSNCRVDVRTGADSEAGRRYTDYLRMPLDTSKLAQLGWMPKVALRDGLDRTFRYFAGA